MLKQAFDDYYFYQLQIEAYDENIMTLLQSQSAQVLVGKIINCPVKKMDKESISL